MSTPGCIEFNEPTILWTEDILIESGVFKDYYFTRTTSWTSLIFIGFISSVLSLVILLFRSSAKTALDCCFSLSNKPIWYSLSSTFPLIVYWFIFIFREKLNCWEPLNIIWLSDALTNKILFFTGLASISTAAILMIPSKALATFSYSGAKFLQCPHHGAKNSTNHKPRPPITLVLKSF